MAIATAGLGLASWGINNQPEEFMVRIPSAEPYFHFSRHYVDGNVLVVIDYMRLYGYHDGVARQLQSTPNSARLQTPIHIAGRRHIHTEQLRWTNQTSLWIETPPPQELAFDWDEFSYTITAIAADEQRYERVEHSNAIRWLWEGDSELNERAYGKGTAEAMLLRLLTEPDFSPEQVEFELYFPDVWGIFIALGISLLFMLVGFIGIIVSAIKIGSNNIERGAAHATQSQNDISV